MIEVLLATREAKHTAQLQLHCADCAPTSETACISRDVIEHPLGGSTTATCAYDGEREGEVYVIEPDFYASFVPRDSIETALIVVKEGAIQADHASEHTPLLYHSFALVLFDRQTDKQASEQRNHDRTAPTCFDAHSQLASWLPSTFKLPSFTLHFNITLRDPLTPAKKH